jgi:hypothetical protein
MLTKTKALLSQILALMGREDSDAHLLAQDNQLLGRLSNPSHPESILNEYGPHGNSYSPLSIFNSYSQYGNRYGPFSVRNQYAVSPPKVMADGSALCVVSANPEMVNAVDPDDFIFVLMHKKLPGIQDQSIIG